MNDNDRSIVGLVTVAHAMVHTYELSIPLLLPLWLAQFDRLDLLVTSVPVNAATLGLLVTVGFALFGLGSLPSGVLVDRVPARVLITGCLTGMGASFLVLAVAPSAAFVGVALALWGIAASAYHPSGLSLISRGVEDRGSAFAFHGMAGNVGTGVGPMTTIVLLLALSWRAAAAILAVPALAAAVFAVRVDIDEHAAVAADGGGQGDRAGTGVSSLGEFLAASRALFAGAFVVVFAVVLFDGLFYRGVITFLPELLGAVPALHAVDVAGRTFQASRYVYVGMLIVGIGGQYVGGRLTDRWRPETGLAVGFLALAVVAVLFLPAAAGGLPGILSVVALLGFFLFFIQPLYQAAVAEYTPADLRGLSYGFTYLGEFGLGAFGAVAAGTLLTYFAAEQLFVLLAGLGVCGAALAGYLVTRAPSTAAEATQ
ncbi:MAG: MFS transporter [Haloarculaceae archaeon]